MYICYLMPPTTMWSGHNSLFHRAQKRLAPKHKASKRQSWSSMGLLNPSFRHFVSTPRSGWTAGKAKLEMIYWEQEDRTDLSWRHLPVPSRIVTRSGGGGEIRLGRDGEQDGWQRASWSQKKPQSGGHLAHQALFWKLDAFPNPSSDFLLLGLLSGQESVTCLVRCDKTRGEGLWLSHPRAQLLGLFLAGPRGGPG